MHSTRTLWTVAVLLSTFPAAGETVLPASPPRPEAVTCFSTGHAYDPRFDLGADRAIIAFHPEKHIQSWKQAGYVAVSMYGFRDGQAFVDGPEGGASREREVQTAADGTLLTCGPGSYYMVPDASKTRRAVQYFREAIERGAEGVAPEEPEFFGEAGYSASFQQAFAEHYNRPWVDPASSIEARWDAERLKARMETNMFAAIYEASREMDPAVPRLLMLHSPIHYARIRAGFPQTWAVTGPVDEIVAQVWTGTARSPLPLAGNTAERTFLHAMLEYSSSLGVTRTSDRPLWFLMDPVEDNPDRSMEDYITNYRETLLACLQFPEVVRYQLMPWPERIFGRVPSEYATTVHAVARVLEEQWQHTDAVEAEQGTRGIGVVMGETTAWMNNSPATIGMEGFYGLTVPLVARGIRPEILQMEQLADPGYLDGIHLLLVSTEFAKPMRPEIAHRLIGFAQGGGQVLLFGGRNDWDRLEAWWQEAGYASPLDALLVQSGLLRKKAEPLAVTAESTWKTVAREAEVVRDAGNRDTRVFDVGPWLEEHNTIWIRFSDSLPDDGWGAHLWHLRAYTAGETVADFTPGQAAEAAFMARSVGDQRSEEGRFADMSHYWIYELEFPEDAKAGEVVLDIGNQFRVDIMPRPEEGFTLAGDGGWPDMLLEHGARVTAWPPEAVDAEVLLRAPESGAPVAFRKAVGAGAFWVVGLSPEVYATLKHGDVLLRETVARVLEERGDVAYQESDRFLIRRGPYVAVRVLEREGAIELAGPVVDLLDPALPVRDKVALASGEGGLYVDLKQTDGDPARPALLFSTARVDGVRRDGERLYLTVYGADGTPQVLLFRTDPKATFAVGADREDVTSSTEMVGGIHYTWLTVPGSPQKGTEVRVGVKG